MEDDLKRRRDELQNEFVSGQVQLADLEERVRALRENLARISGAILVIEETLDELRRDGA